MAPDPKLLYYVKNMLTDRPPGRCVRARSWLVGVE